MSDFASKISEDGVNMTANGQIIPMQALADESNVYFSLNFLLKFSAQFLKKQIFVIYKVSIKSKPKYLFTKKLYM